MTLVGDGHADNGAALQAMLDEGGTVHIPPPEVTYACGRTLYVRKPVHIVAEDFPHRPSFTFGRDLPGMVFEPGAKFSTVSRLSIAAYRGWKDVPGILLQTRVHLEHFTVSGFPGDGILVAGWNGAGTNANKFSLAYCLSRWNGGNGLHVVGADANAGSIVHFDAEANGRWGVLDESFLSNSYSGGHLASNGTPKSGMNGDHRSSLCHWNGWRYAAHPRATPERLVASPPDVNLGWIAYEEGGPTGNALDWVEGLPVGTFFSGGAAALGVHPTAKDKWSGMYAEQNQGPVYLGHRAMVQGGNAESKAIGKGLMMHGEHISNGSLSFRDRTRGGRLVTLDLMPSAKNGVLGRMWTEGMAASGVDVVVDGDALAVRSESQKRWKSKEKP